MRPRHVRSGKGEEGGLLIIVMIGAAVASIGLAVATQSWSSVSRRDKEEELIFRGNQYVDAILAYRKEPASFQSTWKTSTSRGRAATVTSGSCTGSRSPSTASGDSCT
jgi:type II secretory pathway pseudopilin PulG